MTAEGKDFRVIPVEAGGREQGDDEYACENMYWTIIYCMGSAGACGFVCVGGGALVRRTVLW